MSFNQSGSSLCQLAPVIGLRCQLIAQMIPFCLKAEVYLGLSLDPNLTLLWHAHKCLSCQLFFSLLYAALMFMQMMLKCAETRRQDVSLCSLFGQFASSGFCIIFVPSRKNKEH